MTNKTAQPCRNCGEPLRPHCPNWNHRDEKKRTGTSQCNWMLCSACGSTHSDKLQRYLRKVGDHMESVEYGAA